MGRIVVVVALAFGLMGVGIVYAGTPTPEEILEASLRKTRETASVASYVLTMDSEFAGEKIASYGGSVILWSEYPRFRVEAVGLEELFHSVEIVDLEERVSYSWEPERGWAKHVLAADWLALLDLEAHPIFRRLSYTAVEEGAMGTEEVWIVRGELPPGPLGLVPRFAMEIWIDKRSYIDRWVHYDFALCFPRLEITTLHSSTMELTSYRELADVPDERFAVPEGVPAAPDAMGRIFPYPAPDLRGTTPAGEEISLAALRGRVVVLFFWDLRGEMEEIGINLALMEGLRVRGEEHGVAVIGVVEGDPEFIRAFLEGFEAEMLTVTEYGEWAEALRVGEPFTCVLIDPEGSVYAVTDPFSALYLVLELLWM